ncbi:MAG: hypothetical protein CM1200mP22_04640 [Dehalococcoidia bacterium]|nr:MAG: hypothetical protein CM1200mP22_04640 [Dehalococcoidia bacterium]
MGPDCGTSIVGGVGLGFANAVQSGTIGIIGASGTGTQEVTSLAHRWGSGISHAIGVGGRDLSDDIGGISTMQAIDALDKDHNTAVILLISKPPGLKTLALVNQRIAACSKPVITCFLGVKKDCFQIPTISQPLITLTKPPQQPLDWPGVSELMRGPR